MDRQRYLLLFCMLFACYESFMKAGPFAYIAAPTSVVVVDTATNTTVKTIPVPGSTYLYSIALTPDNHYAYVTDVEATQVFAIDLISNAVSSINTSSIDDTLSPLFVVITPDGASAYVSFESEAHLAKISIPSNTITGYLLDAPQYYAYVLAMAPNGKTIYLSGDDETPGNQVSTFSIATQAQSGIGGVGGSGGYIPGLAITSDSNTLFACCAADNIVVPIINLLSSPTVKPGIPFNYPYAMVLNSDNTRGYVIGDTTPNNFGIINLSTNPATVTSTLTVGDNPIFIALTGDGNYAYVSNGTTSIYVVNTRKNSVTSFELDPIGNGIAIATTPPPSNVIGIHKCNVFLDKTERILNITWNASTVTGITSYNIYNGSTLITSVSPAESLSYNALLNGCDTGSNFSVTAVSTVGGESVPTLVTIQS